MYKIIILGMFDQKMTMGPGTESCSAHTWELLLMGLGFFLLGLLLSWLLWWKWKYQQRLAELKTTNTKLQSQYDQLDSSNKSLQSQFDGLKTESTGIKTRFNNLESDYILLKNRYNNANFKLEETEKAYALALEEKESALALAAAPQETQETVISVLSGPKVKAIITEEIIEDVEEEELVEGEEIVEIDTDGDGIADTTIITTTEVVEEHESTEEAIDDLIDSAEEEVTSATLIPSDFVADDLTTIDGIDSDTAAILNNAGIYTWDDLAAQDVDYLEKTLQKTGGRFRFYNPSYWWWQAKYASNQEWDKLVAYRDSDEIGSFQWNNLNAIEGINQEGIYTLEQNGIDNIGSLANASEEHMRTIFAGQRVPFLNWWNQAKFAYNQKWDDLAKFNASASQASIPPQFAKYQSFDLKIVEGVGPKMESILKSGGIKNWQDLASMSVEDIKTILAKVNLEMIDPSTWPKQAELAEKGEWESLQKYQDSLIGGKDPNKI